ncbi:DsrE family protein [Candidatus Bathyarchaeota archaeon]|nr:DsrE family protein [Candidatus Bathyarchaeota archaeon]MCK4481653.1 DsrE family protein [Candidatus Bathyarchaeota archaeon]
MSKNIVVILKKPPHGSLYPAEGLRVAVAVSASETKVVSIGNSVYAFLKETDMTLYKHHLNFLKETEIPVLVDKDSLDERGLTEGDLVDAITVREHSEILNVIAEADATLTF